MKPHRITGRLAVLLVCLIAAQGSGPVFAEILLNINNLEIRGDATRPGYENWINVLSFTHGAENLGCPSSKAGSPQLTDFVFTKRVDKATTPMYQALNNGQTFPMVEFHFTSSSFTQEYEFSNARFQVTSLGGDAFDSVPVESWSLNYTSLTIKYTAIDPKTGNPGPTQSVTLNVFSCP